MGICCGRSKEIIIFNSNKIAAALLVFGGVAFAAYPCIAQADSFLVGAANNIVAYNISQENCEAYQENYLSAEQWAHDYSESVEELKGIVSELDALGGYVDGDYSVDYDSLIYISDVQKEINELSDMRDAAKERKAAEEKKKAEEEAAAARARTNGVGSSSSNSGSGTSSSSCSSGSVNLRSAGIVHANGYVFTWYSQRVLPGGGLNIPGRHVDGRGFVCDGDGYIVAATGMGHGTTGSSPWGAWKSYDTGVSGNCVDLYCNW